MGFGGFTYQEFLTGESGLNYYAELPAKIALGGATTAYWVTNLAAALASRTDAPAYVLCNLGVNDWGAGTNDATIISNYETILDELHTKWPDATLAVAIPWQRTYDARSDSFADTVLPALQVGRAYVVQGIDERVVLEAGDDGETYTDDGLHPNEAGFMRTADAWRVVMES